DNATRGPHADGGGIFSFSFYGSVTLRSSIVAGNPDEEDSAAPDPSTSSLTPTLTNSPPRNQPGPTLAPTRPTPHPARHPHGPPGINAGPLLAATGPPPDAAGNLIGSEAGPLDPLLDPLADNGGPTQTHALRPGSPAIDHGSNPLNLPTDQRGLFRVFGAGA